jgi:hypothetical protein
VGYYMARPSLTQAVRWTGGNQQEVQQEIMAHVTDAITFNEDGTLSITGGYIGDLVPVQSGQWVVVVGGSVTQVMDHSVFAQQFVSVPGNPPFAYVIEGSVQPPENQP